MVLKNAIFSTNLWILILKKMYLECSKFHFSTHILLVVQKGHHLKKELYIVVTLHNHLYFL